MKTQLTVSASAATARLLGPLLGRGVASIPKKSCATFSRVALILLAALSLGQAQTPPDLITYNFAVAETKTLPGTSATPGPPCNGTIAAADQIQSLALVALFYQNACYTDGRYNHNNYLVERGTVTATSGGASFAAYRIHEPQNKATQFLASQHALYYRFPTIENYSVYVFAGGSLSKVAEVPAASIPNTTSFIPVPTVNPITVSTVVGSITYVFAPSSVRVSSYTLLAPGVEAARVASTPFGNVLKYRYTVAGLPFDSARDYTAGPGDFDNIYGTARRFFLVRNGNAGLGVVWQDQTSLALKLTWFGANRQSPTTVALANPQAHTLACAIGDDAGNVYYLTIQPGSGAPNTPRSATLTKAGPTGATIATAAVDTSATGLNLVEFFKGASMQYLSGKLAVIIGRIMTQSGDGLNHQGGIAAIYNATTLALDKNWGQTSGHSWESVLTTNTSGAFVGIDLGDNFPRGVHLHKFTTATRNSRVISGLKTAHGTTPQNPAGTTFPVYSEISGGGTTYYRWSNDNRTYTELGGLAQTALGYSASFVGERSPGGRLLDNSRVGGNLNDPRNVGFITVVENFQSASGSGSEVSNDLVVTPGTVETAGFYSFTGGWTPQRNAGVVWLTSYSTTAQNASRLKMTTRADGSLMLLWEVWTATSYVTTKGLTVGANGTIINAETDLGTHVRLGRRDDPLRFNNSIYLPAGSKADTAVELIVIEPATTSAPSVTTLAATVVTNTTATLNGSATPNGLAAIGFFQWGTTTNYGQTTAAASLGSGTAAVALATPISGLTAGVTYHFRAVSSNSAGIVYGANLSFTTPNTTPAPTVTTLAATDVSYLGATVNGSANPNGAAAFGFFQWGNTTNLGQTTPAVNLGSGSAAVALSAPINVIGGFIGVPFYFRAVASNSLGVVYGQILSWATPPSPNVTTLAATAVSGSGATLNGSATPNGLAAIGYFQWGTNGSYGQTTTPVNLGNGYAAIALAAPISGLTAGLTYHFRAVLSNSANLVFGANLTFTTPGGTSVVIVQSPTNAAACVGGTAAFAVTATGATGYQWQRRNPGAGSFANLAGATAATYTTPVLTTADDGAAYRVIASAPGTSATSGEALLAVISLGTPAVTYNFNAGLPAGTAVYGNAYVDAGTGVLELNPNVGGQNGAFLTADLAPGRAVGGFAATFRARLQQGSSPPADGFSFNWATDLPASIYAMGEEGAGSGLRVAFDTYNNADGEAPAIDVWWNTNLIARRSVSIPFLVRGADFFDVQIRLTTGGLLDLTYGCESIFARLPIPGYVPQTGARFGLGSRTGGLWETHSIDDLALELYSANPNTLTITRSGANVVVSWPPAVRGVLQQSPGVAPTTWSYAPSGATNPITFAATAAARFYRLIVSPTNDLFAGRTVLTGTPLNGTASNAGATKEAGEPAHANNPGGRSLWWSWTAPSNGTVTFTLAGSNFDTTLGVYTGTTVNGLTLVAANDDYDGNLFSRVTFTATQNVTYQIAVDGYDSGGGAGAGTVQWNLTMP